MGMPSSPLSRLVRARSSVRAADLGVVVEHLVEVAHAKQQQGIGAGPLRLLILSHHGGGGHGQPKHEPAALDRTYSPV